MRIKPFSILLFLFIFPYLVQAAPTCEGTGPTRACTAASCSAADIQAALEDVKASGGGSVTLPACDYTSGTPNGALWEGINDRVCIKIDVPLTILGDSKDTTVIGYATTAGPGTVTACGTGHAGYGSTMMEFHGSGLKEWGRMTLHGNATSATNGNARGTRLLYLHGNPEMGGTGMENVRIHDFVLNDFRQPAIYVCQNVNSTMLIDHGYIGNYGAWGTLTEDVTIDQTTIPVTDATHFADASTSTYYLVLEKEKLYCSGKSGNTLTGCTRGVAWVYGGAATHAAGTVVWNNPSYGISVVGSPYESDYVEPPVFGTDNGLFVEDMTFNGTYHPIAGFYGTRETIRYNDIYNNTSAIESHEASYTSGCGYGDQTINYPGGYRFEYYNNTFHGDTGLCTYAFYLRGGHAIVTDNTITGCGHFLSVSWNIDLASGPSNKGIVPNPPHKTLAVNASNNLRVSDAKHYFNETEIGRQISIVTGSPVAWTLGNYTITDVISTGLSSSPDCVNCGDAILDSSPAAAGSTGGWYTHVPADRTNCTFEAGCLWTRSGYWNSDAGCYQTPINAYIWGNTGESGITREGLTACAVENIAYHLHAPEVGDPLGGEDDTWASTYAKLGGEGARHPLQGGGSADTVPPTITLDPGSPTGTVPCLNIAGTDETISWTTNKTATCKYNTTDVAYASMTGTLDITGGTTHSKAFTGLACSTAYPNYIRCVNADGYPNLTSTDSSFTISGLITTFDGGGGSFAGGGGVMQ